MYVYHDEPLPEVSHQEVHDAINGIRNYIESEKFIENITGRILYYLLSSMSYRDDLRREMKGSKKIEKEYDDLLERSKIMRSVLKNHDLEDEYMETWLEREDGKNKRNKEPEGT